MTHVQAEGPALVVRGIVKHYGARSLLSGASFSLAAGEVLAIVGESGAGKSSLLNLIAGLDPAEAGEILIGGAALAGLDDDERTQLRRDRVGFVFQSFHILPQLSVLQNVELPLVLQGVRHAERIQRAGELLAAVGLGDRLEAAPAQLSGGELQRVAVARALVHRPALVLADEPTGNLDPDTAGEVLQVLFDSIRSRRAGGVLVTHSLAAAAAADRVLRLSHGQLVEA